MYRLRKDCKEFLASIPNNVTVVAASKYVEAEQMLPLIEAGVKNFGENRVESFLKKYEELKDKNLIWHFIGHLQRNKALSVIDKIDYLESLDSLKLAKMINENRTSPLKCFVEVSINLEENKSGVPYFSTPKFIEEVLKYPNIELVGLMMMAKKDSSHYSLIDQFTSLKTLKEKIEEKLNITIPYLSMGMSDDYKEAIESGATHIRLGRILWKN